MKVLPKTWRDMETAPRDGAPILACRNNGCGWDHVVVWWNGDCTYPWQSDASAYPDDRMDYWQPLSVPYDIWESWDNAA